MSYEKVITWNKIGNQIGGNMSYEKVVELTKTLKHLSETMSIPEVLKAEVDPFFKIEALAKMAKKILGFALLDKEELEKIDQTYETLKRDLDKIMLAMKNLMICNEIYRIDDEKFFASIEDYEYVVDVYSMTALPANYKKANEYMMTEIIPDKEKIIRAFKDGIKVPGVTVLQEKQLKFYGKQ